MPGETPGPTGRFLSKAVDIRKSKRNRESKLPDKLVFGELTNPAYPSCFRFFHSATAMASQRLFMGFSA